MVKLEKRLLSEMEELLHTSLAVEGYQQLGYLAKAICVSLNTSYMLVAWEYKLEARI